MSTTKLADLIERYRAGLESQLALLVLLQEVAVLQHETTRVADIETLRRAGNRRDRLTSEVMTLEQQLRPMRDRLTRERAAAHQLPGFDHVVALYQTIARMVRDVIETDKSSIGALAEIVAARRAAAQSAEQAEATLAAYGRTAVRPRTATLVNRRG